MTNPMTELEETVERVRSKLFPELPSDLVRSILQSESECVESRTEAMRLVGAAIQAFLDSQET